MQNNQDTLQSLSSDLRFLIACCRTERSEEDTAFLQGHLSHKDAEGLEALVSLSVSHGILPLAYKSIKEITEQQNHTVPMDFLTKLKTYYMGISQRNMLMSAELIRIMKLLEENGIEALAFKGPALAQAAYGDITLRQFSDLDILVREEDIYKAAELIVAQNYEPMDSIVFLQNEAKLQVEKNYEFYGRKNGIKVEIHWRLINSSFLKKFKNYDVFDKQEEVQINKVPIPTLDTKILLLYLCNHGASHMWERLEWIADIDRLIRSEGSSWKWDEILELAGSLQSKMTLLLGLALSRELFHTDLPSSISAQLDTDQISKPVSMVLNTFDSDLITKDHTSHEKNLKVFRFHLALQDSLATKAGFVLQTLFGYSDRDVMSVNLPRPLFFLYYPLRILRIIDKYTLTPIKGLFSKTERH